MPNPNDAIESPEQPTPTPADPGTGTESADFSFLGSISSMDPEDAAALATQMATEAGLDPANPAHHAAIKKMTHQRATIDAAKAAERTASIADLLISDSNSNADPDPTPEPAPRRDNRRDTRTPAAPDEFTDLFVDAQYLLAQRAADKNLSTEDQLRYAAGIQARLIDARTLALFKKEILPLLGDHLNRRFDEIPTELPEDIRTIAETRATMRATRQAADMLAKKGADVSALLKPDGQPPVYISGEPVESNAFNRWLADNPGLLALEHPEVYKGKKLTRDQRQILRQAELLQMASRQIKATAPVGKPSTPAEAARARINGGPSKPAQTSAKPAPQAGTVDKEYVARMRMTNMPLMSMLDLKRKQSA